MNKVKFGMEQGSRTEESDEGLLADGEAERAKQWGASLASVPGSPA
ncbi:MAG: hypothetical protein QM705_15900 [Ancrocorticia sp.]